jgi:hypothetical protein
VRRLSESGIPRSIDWATWFSLLVPFAILVGLAGWFAFYATADCSSLGWLPVSQMPFRCLSGIVR